MDQCGAYTTILRNLPTKERTWRPKYLNELANKKCQALLCMTRSKEAALVAASDKMNCDEHIYVLEVCKFGTSVKKPVRGDIGER